MKLHPFPLLFLIYFGLNSSVPGIGFSFFLKKGVYLSVFFCLFFSVVYIDKVIPPSQIQLRLLLVSVRAGKSSQKGKGVKEVSGKIYGYSYFLWIEKKYSHTLGNIWKLVSHIWELCGFLNSMGFYSKPLVWEYISFPHNIPIGWNFTLPILCGLCGFRNNF